MSTHVVVFDIEGVLIDVSKRIRACMNELTQKYKIRELDPKKLTGSSKLFFWRCFLSKRYLHLDQPIECNIQLAKKLQQKFRLILITGAPHFIAKIHEERLKNHGLTFEIFSREPNDRTQSSIFKERIVLKLIAEGFIIEKAYDDDIENCKMFSRYAREVYLVNGCKYQLFSRKKSLTDFF